MRRALILVLLVLMALLSSCKDEVLVKIDPDLVGTWKGDHYTYIFEGNGRFKQVSSYSGETETLFGKWTTSDGILRCEYEVSFINDTSTISSNNPMYIFVRGSHVQYDFYVSKSPSSFSYADTIGDFSPFTFDGINYVYERNDDSYHEKCTITIKDSVILISDKWKGQNGGEEFECQLVYKKGSVTDSYDYKITNAKYTSYVDISYYSVSGSILQFSDSSVTYTKQ